MLEESAMVGMKGYLEWSLIANDEDNEYKEKRALIKHLIKETFR